MRWGQHIAEAGGAGGGGGPARGIGRGGLGILLGALALLAVSGLWGWRSGLPAYALAVGTRREVLDQPGARPSAPLSIRCGARSLLAVVARPEVPVEGPVDGRAFLMREGDVRALAPQLRLSPSGALWLLAQAREVMIVPPGRWELVLFVGRPGELPVDPRRAGGRTVQRLSAVIDWEG